MMNVSEHNTEAELTPADIAMLQAPLPVGDHEAREKGTNKEKTKKQYLIYINQEGVIPLLNSIDPNWSWEVINVHYEAAYVSVTGRLTIKGVSRDGVGGNSPNGSNSPVDEDTVKGAETDALKRAALRYGVGLYLRSAPTFWIDASLPPWQGAEAALKEFTAWYQREFGKKQSAPKAPAPSAPTASTPPTSTSDASDNVAGLVDWILLYELAYAEKLVKAKDHFKNLISKMRASGEVTDAMNQADILEAMRKHQAAKDLEKEQAS